MDMKSSIDRYIAQATIGLPGRKRVDTAAELRVHLNSRSKELMVEGFPREEAEHLAVDAMGPVARVNRQFLGHVFTTPVGWAVLVLLVLGGFGWWAKDNLFQPPIGISSRETNLEDWKQILGNSWAYELKPPKEAKQAIIAMTGNGETVIWSNGLQYQEDVGGKMVTRSIVEKKPAQLAIYDQVKIYNQTYTSKQCEGKTPALISFSIGTMQTICLKQFKGMYGWRYANFAKENTELPLNRWIPVWAKIFTGLYDDLKDEAGKPAGYRTLSDDPNPNNWIVLQIYLSDKVIDERNIKPPHFRKFKDFVGYGAIPLYLTDKTTEPWRYQQ
jgi:hypothetical protein